MPATPIKKLLSCKEKNRRKSGKKQKQNICNRIRLYSWYVLVSCKSRLGKLEEKSLQPPEVNGDFGAEPLTLGEFLQFFFLQQNKLIFRHILINLDFCVKIRS